MFKHISSLLGLLLLALSNQALSQSQPTVKLIVGYTAGGPVDAGARIFAPYFSKELGRPVIVENRPGASGAIAGDAVSKSPPDGNMLFFAASPTMTITPHVLKTMPFNTQKDLAAVAPLVSYANVLVINKEQPFKNLPELIAYAKANPGKLAYGSAGMGASNHLSGELFAKRAGISMNHIPYKGNSPAMTDVIGGQINMMFDIIGSARNYINGGKVTVVAVTSKDRNSSMPNVPTMQEAGVPDYDVSGWYGLYGPTKMPQDLIQTYNEAARRALANEELKAKLIEQGYDLWIGEPKVLEARATRELKLWATVTKGIKFE
jgi:tripartite-type tricarboxylate transporter receptor subunit TctC